MKNLVQIKSKYLISVSKLFVFIFIVSFLSCKNNSSKTNFRDKIASNNSEIQNKKIITGADQTHTYLPLLKSKRVAVVANQTSVIVKEEKRKKKKEILYTHLIDSLIYLEVNIVKVFAPEHGFRGKADAGEHVVDNIDEKTNLPIISLFGENRKPQLEVLDDVDVVLFDIQDVGVRFYTYISTMTYVMEACAEMGIPMIILDRPNPNGHYIDGPTLEIEFKSFVGMHPIPLVYGLTIGEYANMVNGEKWLKNGVQCDITVIPLKNYTHKSEYSLPIRPSPNLPNDRSINLYPSLGFFEGTIINTGRGTEFQFQRYGAPFFPKTDFSYTPRPNFGSKYPKFDGQLIYGVDLSRVSKLSKVDISYLLDAYQKTPKDKYFFGKTFTAHAGTLKLRKQIEAGMTEEEISASWKDGIEKFKKIREKYLIYN
jgi:uncharacterized protein YbbC (DUF1343 family)